MAECSGTNVRLGRGRVPRQEAHCVSLPAWGLASCWSPAVGPGPVVGAEGIGVELAGMSSSSSCPSVLPLQALPPPARACPGSSFSCPSLGAPGLDLSPRLGLSLGPHPCPVE